MFPRFAIPIIDLYRLLPHGIRTTIGAIVEANENGRIVLDFMAQRGTKMSENEGALVHARAKEWILLVGSNIRLSEAGYRLIGSANDNLPD
jgi:hypothetical protein